MGSPARQDRRAMSDSERSRSGRLTGALPGRVQDPKEGLIRILLLDDDEVDRRAVRRAFASWPLIELIEVEEAKAALEALQYEHFDCAIIDYRLPGKADGLDVIRGARKLGVRTPVVVLTGHGDEETAVQMMKAGASDYIPKAAFSGERVSQSVLNAVRLRAAEDEIERAQTALREAIGRESAARADADLQRERLRAAFLQAPALINVHQGPDHVFELVHPLTIELFGERSLAGQPLRQALPELAGRGVFEAFDRVYATGESLFEREVHLTRRQRGGAEPQDAVFDLVYQPLRDGAGKVEGVMIVAMEVTEMVAARERSERLVKELHNAVRTREDLLAIVSHDLRTPLSIIVGSARSLLGAAVSQETPLDPKHAERIARAAERMSKLISGLLDLAQVDSGTLRLSLASHEARSLAEEALEMVRPAARQKGLLLHNEVAPSLSLCCDGDRLHQILENLLANAVKFTDAGGVSLRGDAAGDDVHFVVTDSGPGIAAAELPHIFDRYWQAQAHAKTGIGLGLSIVKGLVQAHGGRVWAESDLGRGTSIHVVVPRSQRSSLLDQPSP